MIPSILSELSPATRVNGDVSTPFSEAKAELVRALADALLTREPELQIVEHCGRVAAVACRLAEAIGLRGNDVETLRTAALLHEIGMIGVPAELIMKPAPLSSSELERVRAQALIGAEMIKPLYPPVIYELIRHQYDDYLELLRHNGRDSHELLLCGILRAADVLDATSHPRPYQMAMSEERQMAMLQTGNGIKFHPAVTEVLMESPDAIFV